MRQVTNGAENTPPQSSVFSWGENHHGPKQPAGRRSARNRRVSEHQPSRTAIQVNGECSTQKDPPEQQSPNSTNTPQQTDLENQDAVPHGELDQSGIGCDNSTTQSPGSEVSSCGPDIERSAPSRKRRFDDHNDPSPDLMSGRLTRSKKQKLLADQLSQNAMVQPLKDHTPDSAPGLGQTSISVSEANPRACYHPDGQNPASGSGSPRKSARGGASVRGKGGSGPGKGRGKGRGRGARGNSPDPPRRTLPLTDDDRATIAVLRARQQELKRFFQIVGAKQLRILDVLASRDMMKLVRKAKAHKQVQDYEAVQEQLQFLRAQACDLVLRKHRFQFQHELQRYQQEKEVIEQRFKVGLIST